MVQLSERLQQGLFKRLGWRELRPVQEQTLQAVLDGCNLIVLAPTAGGKTEAAMLPVVEVLAPLRLASIGALYVSPLRALLNNQEQRLQELMGLGGMSVFKWHGDVEAHRKRSFVEEPAQLLMITPESLEVIFSIPRYYQAAVFSELRFVVVDEVHSFAGDDRGDHLVALLERLQDVAKHDVQRIGLSATVANPDMLVEWLSGSSPRERRVVRPDTTGSGRVIEIHPFDDLEDSTSTLVSLLKGKKAVFFADSRSNTERLRVPLEENHINVFVHHSAVSKDLREEAERAFRQGSNCCILATSTMELGLDVGDLDLVLQLDAPSTVSSFLQRLGRTGRRPGTKGRLAFITDSEWTFLQAVALVSLASKKRVEAVEPTSRSAHVFMHQVLARILQHSGLPPRALLDGVGAPYCFRDLSEDDRVAILQHLVKGDILASVDGLLTFGNEGEKRFGRGNFRELYSVFETPRQLTVKTTNNKRVGTLETWFAQALQQPQFLFMLAGRTWLAVECDFDKALITVKPAPKGKVPQWRGNPKLLSRMVCEEMRELLISEGPLPFLADDSSRLLESLRAKWSPLLSRGRLVLHRNGDNLYLWTFAGGRINNVFGRLLGVESGIDNFRVRVPLPLEGDYARPALDALAALPMSGDDVNAQLTGGLKAGRLSKFQDYLPTELGLSLVQSRLLDVYGAKRLVTEGAVAIIEDTVARLHEES
ncbi:MAG: DEAD/DEAH box helicase [Candidatus Xenobia bacterium]